MYTLLSHYPAWESLLQNNIDRSYLLDVVKNGLWISQNGIPVSPFKLRNYRSVVDYPSQLTRNLQPELTTGRVVKVNQTQYANAVGLIPKSGSSEMRRITDLSRPFGASVNESIPDRRFKFQTLDFAMTLMKPDCYMAILDIRHAYRHIVIRPRDWDLQSFQIGENSYQDRCLSFGLKIAPEVFTRFTRAVVRIMSRMGYTNIMAYLDEFFITGNWDTVWETLVKLIHTLQSLGFYIHWGKLVLPAQLVKFLGFLLDSQAMSVTVPPY